MRKSGNALTRWVTALPLLLFCSPICRLHAGETPWPATLLEKADRVIKAYPEHLARFHSGDLVWTDGTRMLFDDGEADKPFNRLLNAPDIEDQFAIPYPLEFPQQPPGKDHDPGRIRNVAFFVKMYGDCLKGEVAPRLASVAWMPKRGGGTFQVTTINTVHEKLKAISDELEALPEEFTKYVVPAAGGYACRTIAGTSNRSAHAYGAAIDISPASGNYWRWEAKGKYQYRNRIPAEIVRIFEKHGFIWGGKWYHFDTLHFEYRPELLPPR
jgi:hypothetical protein